MRRFAVLAAAALVSVSTGAFAAGPATAAGSALSVTTLGRNGKAVSTEVRVIDVRSASSFTLTSGHPQRLPRGTYDVVADIFTPADQSDTIAAQRVTMSGAHRLTLDARKGRALRARLSPAAPAGYRQRVSMSVCGAGGFGVLGYSLSNVIYVVPSSSRTVELAYSSSWQPADDTSRAPSYLAATVHHGGVPSGGTMTFRQASMASIIVSAHRGAQTGSPTIELDGSVSNDVCVSGTRALWTRRALPYVFAAHVTAGSWTLSEDGQDYVYGRLGTLRPGHRYGVRVNAATWGPSGELPYVWSGRNLYLNTLTLFGDPSLHDYGGSSTASYRLTKAGRTVYYRARVRDEGATLNPVLKSRGWYRLTVWAHRSPRRSLAPDAQSSAVGVLMSFYADPARVQQVRAYLTGFRPAGLSMSNLARPSSTTTVGLRLLRDRPEESVSRQADSVKGVRVQASIDGGRTWRTAPVRHVGSAWSAAVHNPPKGFVSLRSTVTDTHGGSTTTTVIRAYGVG